VTGVRNIAVAHLAQRERLVDNPNVTTELQATALPRLSAIHDAERRAAFLSRFEKLAVNDNE
jgi:hypothetical protein